MENSLWKILSMKQKLNVSFFGSTQFAVMYIIGQKSRVSFAVLAYQRPHLLIIDEGSNHLSMEAVDALIEAIRDFKGKKNLRNVMNGRVSHLLLISQIVPWLVSTGGLLVVSHDQYFVTKTCNELWVVEEGKAARFEGTFDDYKLHTAKKTQKRVEESVKRLGNSNQHK